MKKIGKSKLVATRVPAKKKNKLYAMPERIAEGTIVNDLSKAQWCIGSSIGIGGFGEIYTACRVGERNYDYVVKCEPHGNGPLFVEMHFYMRNAKHEDIEKFKREHSLKSLGMPYMVGNGSADINGQKHRFIVMPRYGNDINKYFKANGYRLPQGTAYRLAIQMLDVYEFVHSCGYVHADLKGANILLGYGRGGAAQAYLVDYGLAAHYTTKEYKPDPKKMHNGTIEYTSRDAHQGVATMRGDLEILGYNLIEWLGVKLPWVRDNQLAPPTKAQNAKEVFMADVRKQLNSLFSKGVPSPLVEFMDYVANLSYNEKPDYNKCRKMFINALTKMKIPNTGELDFKLKPASNNYKDCTNDLKRVVSESPKTKNKTNTVKNLPYRDSQDVFSGTDDDEEEVFEKRSVHRKSPLHKAAKQTKTKVVNGNLKTKISPYRRVKRIDNSSSSLSSSVAATPSPSLKKRHCATPDASPLNKKPKGSTTPVNTSSRLLRSSPKVSSANAKLNFSPNISMRSRPGKTIINNNITPNPRSKKTYEFNFELDVSMDANVVVNLKRKKKLADSPASEQKNITNHTLSQKSKSGKDGDTPVMRVNLKKIPSAEDSPNALGGPRTPSVSVKKYRH